MSERWRQQRLSRTHAEDVPQQLQLLAVADSYNHKIKAISLHGSVVSTLAGGDGSLWEPSGLDAWGDHLLVADTNHHRVVTVHRQTGEVRPLLLSGSAG